MAKIEMGTTNQKGCHFCGKDIPRALGGNTWVLKGSKGRIAFCCHQCATKYEPAEGEVVETADTPDKPSKKKKRIKPKVK